MAETPGFTKPRNLHFIYLQLILNQFSNKKFNPQVHLQNKLSVVRISLIKFANY